MVAVFSGFSHLVSQVSITCEAKVSHKDNSSGAQAAYATLEPSRQYSTLPPPFHQFTFSLLSHIQYLTSSTLCRSRSLTLSQSLNTEVCGLTSQEMVSHSLNLVHPKQTTSSRQALAHAGVGGGEV